MKKLLYIAIVSLGFICFSNAQQVVEKSNKTFSSESNKIVKSKLSIDFYFDNSKKSEVLSIINSNFGEGINPNKVWSSAKSSEVNYVIKVKNNKLFVRARDNSTSQELMNKINKMIDSLEKYKIAK